MPRIAVWALGAALATLFSTGSALADPTFPAAVEQDWKVPCLPKCTICHINLQGGFGTLRSTTNGSPGFGQNMKDMFDLNTTDLSSIHTALAANKQAGSDVDGDGKTDYDELSTGMDPNDPTPGATICGGGAGPEFGCLHVARSGSIDGAASALAMTTLIGLATLERRRRRRTTR
jgi:hypothetical protein